MESHLWLGALAGWVRFQESMVKTNNKEAKEG